MNASKPVGRFAGVCLTWQNPAAPDPSRSPVLLALGFLRLQFTESLRLPSCQLSEGLPDMASCSCQLFLDKSASATLGATVRFCFELASALLDSSSCSQKYPLSLSLSLSNVRSCSQIGSPQCTSHG